MTATICPEERMETAAQGERITRADSLAGGLLFMLFLTVGQRLIGFVRSVLFCGLLEDDELGRWSLAFSFFLMAAPLAVVGLPGSFGRYVEHYRSRGQLRVFLRRTLIVSMILAGITVAVLTCWAPTWAWLVLGDASLVPMLHLMTLTLIVVIAFNFTTELLTAMRQVKAASLMWFVSSVVFAVMSVVLLLWTPMREQGVVIAFGVSLVVAGVFAIRPLRGVHAEAIGAAQPLSHSDLWSRLLPFATWIWLSNLLANLFDAVDRFMIVHLAGHSLRAADALVGQYHASRVVPYLLITLSAMVGGVILPYMSHDWESGDRTAVRARQRLMLKVGGLALTACGTAVLLGAPILFSWVLRGKYDQGLTVLPLTLTYCVWFGLLTLTQNYLWCAEKARLATAALCIGLLVNVGCNLLWLPRWGLSGAVAATAVGNLIALVLVLYYSHRQGMRFDRGSMTCCLLPALLVLGPWPALALLVFLGLLEWRRGWIFDTADRAGMVGVLGRHTDMFRRRRQNRPLGDRGPLKVLFTITSMPVGGAEVLLANLVRGMDRDRFLPAICCLKQRGPMGDMLADEMPVYSGLLRSKYDLRVLGRLTRLCRSEQIDVMVTVGAGDKMFWGRLAAWRAGVPVVLSALHSTGWPDCVGRMNRWLTPLTDAFIGVAREHGRFLVTQERFPCEKVIVIPNGVDTARFRPDGEARARVRRELAIPDGAPVFGIVAALRPEKDHATFVRAAQRIGRQLPLARFLIVGDGPQRPLVEAEVAAAGLTDNVLLLGARGDIPALLAAMDVFVLTSRMEANPVSILEAMAVGLPVVAPRVGSIPETVCEGQTGFLTEVGDADQVAQCCVELAAQADRAREMGTKARRTVVDHWSLEHMITGYEGLIERIYQLKSGNGSGLTDTTGTSGRVVFPSDVAAAEMLTDRC